MGMCYWNLQLIFSLIWSFCILGSHQLESSQIQVLLQLRKHLEYPTQLEVWSNDKDNICFLSPSTKLNVTCEGNVVTELRIIGDRPSKLSNFRGYSIHNQTLSQTFSMDSFVVTLARLTSLRVLSLVSLGIWGPFPNKIDRLYSLEFLDFSSNFLYGSIPPRIATMAKLQTLRLDGNLFNGSVPNWLDSLSNLSILSLGNNNLEGAFPASILKLINLNTLELSNNKISGELPDLSSLSALKVLDLSGNKFVSELHGLPNGLFMALLSNNSLKGEIPRELEKLSRIEHLDLSLNHFQGRIPTVLLSLPSIGYLNLASNELTGSLPYHLACGERLGFVDISNNRLTGGIPKCLTKTVVQIYGNCLTVDVHRQHPQSYCDSVHPRKKSAAKSAITLIGVIGGIVAVVALLAFGFLFCERVFCSCSVKEQHLLTKQAQESSVNGLMTSEILANARYISEASKTGTQDIPPCRMFSLEELKEATWNFDISYLMGEGSRGKIYKGRLQNGCTVAIRCLSLSNKYTIRNLKLRVDLLAKLRHPHLVFLLGHCIDDGRKTDYGAIKVYLVYEYLPNGDLCSHLSDKDQSRALKWSERLVILNDISKAIHFLHTGVIPGFFNNRLKTNNILLDEHGRAKLSDYGLSIVYDANELGGKGDKPKSWQMMVLEDDIYSFGFIMLDSVINPSICLKKNEFLLKDLAQLSSEEGQRQMVDPNILSTSTKDSLSTVISIAMKCVSTESSTRPSFEDVLWNLQYAHQLQATADGDQRFNSPARS